MDDVLAEMADQEAQLYAQLADCDPVQITGIVSSSGVAGGKLGGAELWSLSLSFDAWRAGTGPLRTDSLTIRRRVSDEELETLQDTIDAETVITIRARLAEENVFACPQALLEEFIGADTADVELHNHLKKIQEPVTYEDELFGTLVFDRRVRWYRGEVKWQGKSIELLLSTETDTELKSALDRAHELWKAASSWNERVRDYAVQELLPLKNESWLDDDEAELTPEQFESRMTLESVIMFPNGSFEFLHDDGDLFYGHSIQICGNLSDGLTDADIPG